MSYPTTIAIDGGAGSGKSTLGALLAESLGCAFVDAGVLYRALTLEVLNQPLNPHDQARIAAYAQDFVAKIGARRGYERLVAESKKPGSPLYGETVNATHRRCIPRLMP